MPDERRTLGQAGERRAASFLAAKGYRILQQNARTPLGELDIIARSPDGVLVFVEVRTRKGPRAAIAAVESIDQRKQRRLADLVVEYLAANDLDETARIDVVAVAVDQRGRISSIQHLENAVGAGP